VCSAHGVKRASLTVGAHVRSALKDSHERLVHIELIIALLNSSNRYGIRARNVPRNRQRDALEERGDVRHESDRQTAVKADLALMHVVYE
jgi:hypothetical protein